MVKTTSLSDCSCPRAIERDVPTSARSQMDEDSSKPEDMTRLDASKASVLNDSSGELGSDSVAKNSADRRSLGGGGSG